MKGWVYIITNKAMPGLVKIGYSTKDPEKRAEELNHTGSPHPYTVEYDILINNPYQVEQRSHKKLQHKREGKEWFRCSSEDAILAIKDCIDGEIFHESYKLIDRQRISKEAEKRKLDLEVKQIHQDIQNQIDRHVSDVAEKYDAALNRLEDEWPYWGHWIVITIIVILAVSNSPDLLEINSSNTLSVMFSGAVSAVLAAYSRGYYVDWIKQSKKYKALLLKKEQALIAAPYVTFECQSCKERNSIKRFDYLNPFGNRWFECKTCKRLTNFKSPLEK